MNRRATALFAAVYAALLLISPVSCGGGAGRADSPPASASEAAPPVATTVTASSEPAPDPETTASADPGITPTAAPDRAVTAALGITPPAGLAEELSGLWGAIDGSTAAIPLTTALHAVFGGAGAPPEHYTTLHAYYNLYNGSADLIFVTYPSESELAAARDLGIELDIIPVVKDALVFLVNAGNPVDGATLEQLRNIYTGKIMNWKTLGGPDESITPYQRAPGSGSQTLLTKLAMGGAEPMRPSTEWIIGAMDILVEVVSSYDNGRDAIGYSMFYYVNNMYGNSRFKLLSVDGVQPSRDTIARGEYPLEDYYYAVTRKDTPAGSPSRRLVDWLLTEDGQRVAARAGYIPLRPLENVLPGEGLDPVYLGETDHSRGTGGTELKPADALDELVVHGVRKPLSDVFYDGFNYIRHINSEIMDWLNSPMSAYQYSESPDVPPMTENSKRPFAGIPSGYPNYELADMGSNHDRYLRVHLPESNPFFRGGMTFDIRLTSDISPYGVGAEVEDFSAEYHRDRRMLPNVDLFTLTVELPQSPEIAEEINRRLKAWTDGFPGDGDAELLDAFVKWYTNTWDADLSEYAYWLQPVYGRWGDYLSVSYPLMLHDGPWTHQPVLHTLCFDMNTGEAVNLAEHLPQALPYSKASVFDPIVRYEAGTSPSQAIYADYVPAEGSVMTSAWILEGGGLGAYVTEPDGRRLQIDFYGWE
ncbi:MAG: substrate-binding domain-containing protein [Peptococcaceae bacterium]|jgi:phosphate transport system substrate-binding protein|nr:substrate-binding domain-containing protein [Peptococcaceae bacterium]